MKKLFRLFAIGLFLLIVTSCCKDDDIYQPNKNLVTKVTKVTVQKEITQGEEGGATFRNTSLTGKSAEGGMFISQFPLVEYRYLQDVTYDSIVTQVIDTITQEIISETIERPILTRDTIGYESGPLWQPFDKDNSTKVLVGMDTDLLIDNELKLSIDVTDGLDSNDVGLLFTYYKLGTTVKEIAENDVITFDINSVTLVDDIPIFGEDGTISGYSSGIELTQFLTKHFQIVSEVDRSFRLTIIVGDESVSADFSFKFVPNEVYEDRQCWLESEFDCKDLF